MTFDDLFAALLAARLVTPELQARARAEATLQFPDGPERDSAAVLINALGLHPSGYLSYDFHFWNETPDVVADFASGLPSCGLRLELLELDRVAQRMRVRLGVREVTHEEWVDVDGSVGGLDGFAHLLNQLLAELGAMERISALETNELDWHVFVIRRPPEVDALVRAGWIRPLRP